MIFENSVDISAIEDMNIASIHCDSREVKDDSLFVAVKGLVSDGHSFIEKAVEKGARVIISEKEIETDARLFVVKDSRAALSKISDNFYGNPSKALKVIGVTGTNGKTSITYMIESILDKAGIKSGVIGTINYRFGGDIFPNPRTTPESHDLNRILDEMRENSVTHVIMEVSSHAIDLLRVNDIRFDMALFTNLTQDHLDFHKDMESYFKSKKKLFTDLLKRSEKRSSAVINIMDGKGRELSDELKNSAIEVLTTGTEKSADLYADNIKMDMDGISFNMISENDRILLKSNAVGNYNIENILLSAGAASHLGISSENIKEGLKDFVVPGRLERVMDGKNVFVDYAHTPDALENVLSTLKNVGAGKLITVFGCGGDRDRSKRPLMGEIAEKYSDISLITSDNPRTENPEAILNDIEAAYKSGSSEKVDEDGLYKAENKVYHLEVDRRKAIEKGIKAAGPEDTVIIAGKGHETYQEIGKERFAFNDAKIAKGILI